MTTSWQIDDFRLALQTPGAVQLVEATGECGFQLGIVNRRCPVM